jgi:hypothetical protein
MQRIEYRDMVDKSAWGDGPWQSEPDKIQWQDKATGLPCLIVRGPVGALCGYVGVAPGHPFHGKNYHDVDVEIHGGLTFSDECCQRESGDAGSICHVADEGEPDDVWWFGFDCAHAWDRCPVLGGTEILGLSRKEEYRTIDYVERQCRELARQLSELRG